ncbi:MAG: hypothetical protein UZ19_OD1000572 [Parcubacteria bacterium OLB19]|nr:MAG: hypothetical protein UZ19_OD1000572 [Parcubacteria bacterium OLB19]
MKNIFSEFVEAYKQASQETKQIIDSDKIAIFIDEILKDNQDYSKHKSKLISLVTYRLLEIIDQNYLIDNLKEIGITEPESLSSKIESFVQEALGNNKKPEEPINIDTEIKETEAVLNSMNHIRTMSGDSQIARETVHVSSQFDLFGLRSKKTEEKDNSVKWETDK